MQTHYVQSMRNYFMNVIIFSRKKIRLTCFFICLIGSVFSTANQAQSSLLLENVRVIVGDGTVLENTSLLIEDGVISAIGSASELQLSDTLSNTTERFDYSGKTVIPALIDAHAHLGYESYTSWGAQNYSRENLIDHLNRYAYYGFSAVFSAGTDPDDLALALQQDQLAGEVGGARFLFAAGMAPPGQGPNNQFLEHALQVERRTGMTVLRGLVNPEQARAAVREVAAKEIAFIKIWVDDRGGTQQKLNPELYTAVIEEAQLSGIDVVVHQQAAADMPGLIGAGASGFLHGRIGAALTNSIVQQAQAADVFVVPNLGLAELRLEALAEDSFLMLTMPASSVPRLSATNGQRQSGSQFNSQLENELQSSFMQLVDSGVDIVLGTDAGALPDHPFGYSGHRELEIFVRLGMSPLQAITAATSTAAERLGLNDLGLLQPGFSADLIVLNDNPLLDIRNTRSINQVYLRGELIDRTALAAKFIAP